MSLGKCFGYRTCLARALVDDASDAREGFDAPLVDCDGSRVTWRTHEGERENDSGCNQHHRGCPENALGRHAARSRGLIVAR